VSGKEHDRLLAIHHLSSIRFFHTVIAMRYISTRGYTASSLSSSGHTFTEILLGGLAPDGGLYLPETYPQVSRDELEQWRYLSYAELAYAVLSRFIDDIPAADLQALLARTYTAGVYCNGRSSAQASEITPLRWLERPDSARAEGGLAILELSNGPTLAFKDMAMQLLGNLFEYVLARQGEEINILGATSGDTGSSAEHAMRGKKGIQVFMLSPHERNIRFPAGADVFAARCEYPQPGGTRHV